MATINPYLQFRDVTEEAFNFYKSVFGGEFATLMRYGDMPGCDDLPADKQIPESDKGKIMHVALPIGDNSVLMGTDILESRGDKFETGSNFSISIGAESREEADRLFNGLSEGGKVEMPLQNTFWGGYFGMFEDKFGIQWMINYDQNQQQ